MINYKGTPLFGKGSSVQHTSEFFAITGTILFWLIFLIFSFVIKPQPKKKYKEVQIVLSSTPVVQKTEEAPAPAEQAAAPTAASAPEEPVVEKVVETPKPTPAPKPKVEQKTVENPAPKKAESPKPAQTQTPARKLKPATPKSVPTTYARSVDDMIEEQFNKKTTESKIDDFDKYFPDEESEESSDSNQTQTVQNNAPAFSGSAGTAASKPTEKVTSQSSTGASSNNNVSTSTSKALEGIRNSTFRGNSTNGVQSETTAKTKTSGSGRVEMEMSNGRSRALVKPASPVITLSAAAAATIDTSKTVSINFKVLEAGNVIEISITPESILTSIVREEIKNQISQWLFEAADYTATASFEYKIIKQ